MRPLSLNCGTLAAPGRTLVCHVLLLESRQGLALVDSGFGLADVAQPARIGPVRHLIAPVLREPETAVRRIQALGLDPGDVSDIVLTHGDVDHAGGLGDFPRARVHLTAAELAAVRSPRGVLATQRYRRVHWRHGPALLAHPPGTLRWKGFEQVVDLDPWIPGALLVPLPGHTAGHAGVAVRTESQWLLHAGDALQSPRGLARPRRPDVRWRQALLAQDVRALRATQRALDRLAAEAPDVRIVSSHDPAPPVREPSDAQGPVEAPGAGPGGAARRPGRLP